MSTLPREIVLPTSSRKVVSSMRSSSGSRKFRSRKRLLTLRISTVRVPCSVSALAEPKAVMLRIMVKAS